MANAIDVGTNATVSIGTIHVPANVSGTGPDATRGLQKIVLALGLANNLVGYSPSSSAKSGFAVSFSVPYAMTAADIAAIINPAGVDVAMQFGTAGGVSMAGCQWFDFSLTATAGSGTLDCKVSYESNSMPVIGATVTAMDADTDVYKGIEIVSCKGVSGTVYTDVDSFTMALTRNLAKAGRNNSTGRPKHLKGTSVEARMTAKYLKDGDGEGTAWMGVTPDWCPAIGDMVVIMHQACATTPTTLTLTVAACQLDTYPKTEGNTEDYIWETITGVASHGAFSVA